ncbi:MAG: hypothetical protein WCA35_16030 [Kovacikia sp.]
MPTDLAGRNLALIASSPLNLVPGVNPLVAEGQINDRQINRFQALRAELDNSLTWKIKVADGGVAASPPAWLPPSRSTSFVF